FLVASAWWSLYPVIVGGDHFALFRFLLPVIVLWAIAVSRMSHILLNGSRAVPMAIGAALIIASNAMMLLHPQRRDALEEVRLAANWADIGRWCASHLKGSLATLTVGAIPYYCDRITIDPVG